MNAPHDLRPWSCLPVSFTGFEPTARVLEILDLVAISKIGVDACRRILQQPPHLAAMQISRRLGDCYVDLSQNPARRAYSSAGDVAKCLTTSSRIYSFRRQGLVLPLELLYWQGHSRSVRLPGDMPQSSIRDLAGEGICLPVLGSIVMCLCMAGAFPAVIRPQLDA